METTQYEVIKPYNKYLAGGYTNGCRPPTVPSELYQFEKFDSTPVGRLNLAELERIVATKKKKIADKESYEKACKDFRDLEVSLRNVWFLELEKDLAHYYNVAAHPKRQSLWYQVTTNITNVSIQKIMQEYEERVELLV